MKAIKKILAVGFIAVLLAMTACGAPAMTEVTAAVKTAFSEGESFVLFPAPEELSGEAAVTTLGLSADSVKDAAILRSSDPEWCDTVACVIPNGDEYLQSVKDGLLAYREALIAKWREMPINGCYERAKTSIVAEREGCVLFICVGRMPEDTDEELYFDEDILAVMNAADSVLVSE